jgi:hypothetical protein
MPSSSYNNSFVDKIIETLVLEAAAEMREIPADLEKNYEAAGGWTGLLAGVGAGAMAGAHIGIAGGPFGAIAGTIPGAIVRGMMGFFGGQKVGAKIDPDAAVSTEAENLGRVVRSCPSCHFILRLPVGVSGEVKCPMCAAMFRAVT